MNILLTILSNPVIANTIGGLISILGNILKQERENPILPGSTKHDNVIQESKPAIDQIKAVHPSADPNWIRLQINAIIDGFVAVMNLINHFKSNKGN